MTNKESTTKRKRLHWLDNLRTITILLVVLYHVGGVYAGTWGWFWLVVDPDPITWVSIVGIMFDIMVMPIMFFVSGYLTPASLTSKSGWGFVKDKFKRLMIPWILAVFTLIPLYKVIFLYSRGLPQEHWTTYFHFNSPNSQIWLWFLPVLFLFDSLYLLLSKANIRIPNLSFKWAVLGASLIGLLSSYFIGNMLGFRSWTLTPILDFENERLFVYFLAFLIGALSFQKDIFAQEPKSKTLYNIANGTSWIPITAHIFARLWPFFSPDPTEFVFTPLYRLAYWVSFHLSVLVLVYLMIESFRRYLDKNGKIWGELNRNSYGVYIIHVILIGVFGMFLINLNIPAVVKWILLIISTYLGSNLVVSLYRSLIQTIKSSRDKSATAEIE